MHTKTIRWMGRLMVLACDGKCNTAWGISQRPKEQIGPDDDDVAWLSDGELGDAPHNPGTYEGGCAKPHSPAGMNRWCARECERSDMAVALDRVNLRDWSERVMNQPWKHDKTHNAELTGPRVGHWSNT